MPLYEYLIITKAGPARPTMLMLHEVISTVLNTHPSVVIRDVQNLGDRIMGNKATRETRTHSIGRYIQIIMDAPPAAGVTISQLLKKRYKTEVFGNNIHRIKDLDYYLNTYFRANRLVSHFNDERDFEYARRVMEMKNKIDKED
jgi:hypothetical protein